MKTKITVTLFFLCCTHLMFAQTKFSHAESLIKIGTDISFLSSDLNAQKIPLTGIHIGISPTIPLGHSTYFKPEIAFSMKGGRLNYQSTFGYFEGDVSYKINYFEFPMVFGIRPKTHFAIEFGPYTAIKAGGSFSFQGNFASGYANFDRKDIHDFDFGIVAGIKIGPFGILYYHGLQEIAATTASRAFLGNSTNHSIQICLQRRWFRKFKTEN